jgi:hypothetical protein
MFYGEIGAAGSHTISVTVPATDKWRLGLLR